MSKKLKVADSPVRTSEVMTFATMEDYYKEWERKIQLHLEEKRIALAKAIAPRSASGKSIPKPN